MIRRSRSIGCCRIHAKRAPGGLPWHPSMTSEFSQTARPDSPAGQTGKLPDNCNVVRRWTWVSPWSTVAVVRVTVMNSATVHIWNPFEAAKERSRCRTTKLPTMYTVSIASSAQSMDQRCIRNAAGTAGRQCRSTQTIGFHRWHCMNDRSMDNRCSHDWRWAMAVAAFAKSMQSETITSIHT